MNDGLSDQEKAYVFQQWEHHKATVVKEYILQHYPLGTLEKKEQHERNRAKWIDMVQQMLIETDMLRAMNLAEHVAKAAGPLVVDLAWHRQLMNEVMMRIPIEARIILNGRLVLQKQEGEEE